MGFITLAVLFSLNLEAKAQQSVSIYPENSSNLTFFMPQGWSMQKDKEGHFMFSNTNRPGTFYIFLVNYVFNYNTPDEKNSYINAHRQEMLKGVYTDVEQGTETIKGMQVPYLIMPDQSEPGLVHKIFYVSNNYQVYTFTATLTQNAPVDDGEKLLDNIAQAILNK